MPSKQEVQRFLQMWTDSWGPASTGQKILHPGGGIQYPGEKDLYNPDEDGKRTDEVRQLAPDLQMQLLSWAEREGVLFAEWELSCTLRGRKLRFAGVNRFNLKGDLALEGRAFIDRLELLEFVQPDREVLSLGALLAQAVRTRD